MAKQMRDEPQPQHPDVPAESASQFRPWGPTFPVVGLGASAGGLAAFEAFFSGMPADREPGMAFILVQQLAPDYKSLLAELVRRYTRMRVFEVEDGMSVEPNCAYIIPPNRDMAFLAGKLHLLETTLPRGPRLPIDFFFRSLAQDLHERAICIILSGTGSDGTLGARAIKGEGGLVMAQTPETTEYDGMPRSAIAAGQVDFVLPPGAMPAQLIDYVDRAFPQVAPEPPAPLRAGNALKRIFVLLRAHSGHDFSQYKPNTVLRRVERRMAVNQIDIIDKYVRFLQGDPAELQALFSDMLIGVTSFFRDPAAFEALRAQAIPSLFAGRSSRSTIRVWVPGCSTGEEAYSIAILLHEYLQDLPRSIKIQVFASDIDSRAIEQARIGAYPASIAADVSPERLARYFAQEGEGASYRIRKNIRDILIFSEQDIIKDPPFSRIDLISCRNLLIYLNGELQKRIIPRFHYALNPAGFLLLGTSETVSEYTELFSAVDRHNKLFQRKPEPPGMVRHAARSRASRMTEGSVTARPQGRLPAEPKASLRQVTERALLNLCTPSAALIDERGEIHYLHGRTGNFLEPAVGEAAMSILKMAREGLRQPLVTSLHRAVSMNESVCEPRLRVKTNGGYSTVRLTVQPVQVGSGEAAARMFLVTLETAAAVETAAPAPTARPDPTTGTDGSAAQAAARIQALQQELRAKEEYVQTTNEELETSNEELKSSNEEMQSVNEELQSANEELETSKEELQSVNEELATVNAELQQKVADLSRANNDLNNLLAGTGIGTVFVDHHLRIMRFTPVITQVINLIPSDVGRPVSHIVSNLIGYDRLEHDVLDVLESLVPKEVEVQTKAGTWYLLRIRPYRTLENVIEGAVIAFVEISDKARNREE